MIFKHWNMDEETGFINTWSEEMLVGSRIRRSFWLEAEYNLRRK